MNSFEYIKPAQSQRKFTNAIPFLKGIALKIKREFRKVNLFLPIAPERTIFNRLRSEIEKPNLLETAGIYKINYKYNNEKQGVYIGMTKRKIRERMEEHKRDLRYGKITTALSKLSTEEVLEIDFEKVEKLAEYNSTQYALTREAIEILKHSPIACNEMVHSNINDRWQHMLLEENKNRKF